MNPNQSGGVVTGRLANNGVLFGTFGGKFINKIPLNSLPFVKAQIPNSVIPTPVLPNPTVAPNGSTDLSLISQVTDISHVSNVAPDNAVDVKAALFNSPNVQGKITGQNVITPSIAISLRGALQPQMGIKNNHLGGTVLDTFRQDSAYTYSANGVTAGTVDSNNPQALANHNIETNNPNITAASTPTPKAVSFKLSGNLIIGLIVIFLVYKFLI